MVELTASDRCDACGAEAKVKATFLNGELLFCGHHSRKYADQIMLQAASVEDPKRELDLYEPQLF